MGCLAGPAAPDVRMPRNPALVRFVREWLWLAFGTPRGARDGLSSRPMDRHAPRRIACWLLAALAGLAPVRAMAQFGFDRPGPLPALGRDPVSNHDTTAAVTNPALLGFLPGAELRWSSIYLDESATVPWQGHALAFGFPIDFLHLGTALRLDLVSPPDQAMTPDSQFLTWAVGIRTSRTSSIGFSWQHTYSEARWLHGLDSWSLGWSARPWDAVGLAVAGHAINSPSNSYGGHLDPAWDVGMSIRPLGTDVVELGLQGTYVFPDARADYWIPRASLGIRVPSLGRLQGDVAIVDPDERAGRRSWLISGGLAIDFNGPEGGAEFAASTLVGNGLGHRSRYRAGQNLGLEVAFRGWRESKGVEIPHFAVRIQIEDTPDAREHVALLRRLWSIAHDEPAVDAVVLVLRDAPSDGMARAEELRDAVTYLRANGKKVVCHLQDAESSALQVCSAADRVLMHPAGAVRFAGLSSTQLYFKGLLDKLGIRADFVRIGEHKSAPEMFTREHSSDVAHADRESLMHSAETQWLYEVAKGRHLSPEVLASRIAEGPFVSSEAKQAGLIDDYAYEDQIEDKLKVLVGHPLPIVDEVANRWPSTHRAVRQIAVVYLDGDLVDGRSQTIPLLDSRMVGATTLAETFRKLAADPGIGAVVLRIESPGGSALAADTLWREVQLLDHEKPVVVSMGAVAASGGYYVAAPARHIFANPATITGSIGVFYGKADVAELLRRIGVNTETIRTTPRADAESIFRPYTEDERRELRTKVAQYYDVFLSRVSIGRHLDKAAVDRVGRGKVYTGAEALGHHLVDELGGLRQALEWARQAAQLPESAPLVELPPPDTSLVARILGLSGVRAGSPSIPLPAQLLDVARGLAPFTVQSGDRPYARLDWTYGL